MYGNLPLFESWKRCQKAGSLGPISSKITLTEEKERKKRKRREEERRRREKNNGCTLSFYNGRFGDSFWRKKKAVGHKGPICWWRFQKSGYILCLYIFFARCWWCLLTSPKTGSQTAPMPSKKPPLFSRHQAQWTRSACLNPLHIAPRGWVMMAARMTSCRTWTG